MAEHIFFDTGSPARLPDGSAPIIAPTSTTCCPNNAGKNVPQEAVIRETFEETGMMMQIQQLLFVQERFYRYQNAEKHELCFYYLMEKPEKPLRMKTDRENERLVYLSKEDLAVKKIIPAVLADTLLAEEKTLFHLITHE